MPIRFTALRAELRYRTVPGPDRTAMRGLAEAIHTLEVECSECGHRWTARRAGPSQNGRGTFWSTLDTIFVHCPGCGVRGEIANREVPRD